MAAMEIDLDELAGACATGGDVTALVDACVDLEVGKVCERKKKLFVFCINRIPAG